MVNKGWLIEFVAPWPPYRRYILTLLTLLTIVFLWWLCGYRHVRHAIKQGNARLLEMKQHEQELNVLDKKLAGYKGMTFSLSPSALLSSILDRAHKADLTIIQSAIIPSDVKNCKSIELAARGVFADFMKFLDYIGHYSGMRIMWCELVRQKADLLGKFIFIG